MTGSVALLGLVGAAILGLVACLSFPLVRSLERTPSILIAITVLLYVLSTLYPGDLLPSLPLGASVSFRWTYSVSRWWHWRFPATTLG